MDDCVFEETTYCERTFACLKGKEHMYCRVEDFVVDRIPFVSCLDKKFCIYNGFWPVKGLRLSCQDRDIRKA
jgi:hypothetical protein